MRLQMQIKSETYLFRRQVFESALLNPNFPLLMAIENSLAHKGKRNDHVCNSEINLQTVFIKS